MDAFAAMRRVAVNNAGRQFRFCSFKRLRVRWPRISGVPDFALFPGSTEPKSQGFSGMAHLWETGQSALPPSNDTPGVALDMLRQSGWRNGCADADENSPSPIMLSRQVKASDDLARTCLLRTLARPRKARRAGPFG